MQSRGAIKRRHQRSSEVEDLAAAHRARVATAALPRAVGEARGDDRRDRRACLMRGGNQHALFQRCTLSDARSMQSGCRVRAKRACRLDDHLAVAHHLVIDGAQLGLEIVLEDPPDEGRNRRSSEAIRWQPACNQRRTHVLGATW